MGFQQVKMHNRHILIVVLIGLLMLVIASLAVGMSWDALVLARIVQKRLM